MHKHSLCRIDADVSDANIYILNLWMEHMLQPYIESATALSDIYVGLMGILQTLIQSTTGMVLTF